MKLVIWGAGGHGKQVCDVAVACGVREIVFIDDVVRGTHYGRPVVGGPEMLVHLYRDGYRKFVMAIGDNARRAKCFARALADGVEAATLIHPTAAVSSTAKIGPGTVVMPGAVVNADAEVGSNCIVNTAAVIEHDCKVGDHAHVSSGAVLGGGVCVGDYALVGLGAVVLPGAVIGEGAVVGAGAVVLKKVEAGETVVGVPARVLAAVGRRG